MKPKLQLIIVRGLPGSGKTTLAKKLKSSFYALHVEADMFFEKDGQYLFQKERIAEAHEWAKKKMVEYLQSDFNVFVSNTFSQKWEYEGYLDAIPEEIRNRLEVTILVCQGQFKNVHGVPDEVIKEMSKRFEY